MTFKEHRLEKDLQDDCIAYLKTLTDCWYIKMVGGATQSGGAPDLIICYRGRFLGVELKVDPSTYGVTGRQTIVLRRINRAGGVGISVTTVEQLKDVIENTPS